MSVVESTTTFLNHLQEVLIVDSSTQPWPYPASLMIGAVAQAKPDGETIKLNDQELDQARWYAYSSWMSKSFRGSVFANDI